MDIQTTSTLDPLPGMKAQKVVHTGLWIPGGPTTP